MSKLTPVERIERIAEGNLKDRNQTLKRIRKWQRRIWKAGR